MPILYYSLGSEVSRNVWSSLSRPANVLQFRYLNVSRSCGKSTIFADCGCDYVLVHQPPFDDDSAKQYCGNYVANNVTKLSYTSKTRIVAVEFAFNSDYGHAFTLMFFAVSMLFVEKVE